MNNISVMKKSARGFTLVELLVVVAIIAVLSVIGITVFSGVQKNARDARRRADVDAIANALEVKKTTSAYLSLDGPAFASGTVPIDSANTVADMTYCVYSDTSNTPIVGPSAKWGTPTCPSATSPASGVTSNSVTATSVTLVGSATNWTVCASLETTTNPTAYCKSSSQ